MNDVIQKIYDIGIVPVIAIDDGGPSHRRRRQVHRQPGL